MIIALAVLPWAKINLDVVEIASAISALVLLAIYCSTMVLALIFVKICIFNRLQAINTWALPAVSIWISRASLIGVGGVSTEEVKTFSRGALCVAPAKNAHTSVINVVVPVENAIAFILPADDNDICAYQKKTTDRV